jgi:hypothetical protein
MMRNKPSGARSTSTSSYSVPARVSCAKARMSAIKSKKNGLYASPWSPCTLESQAGPGLAHCQRQIGIVAGATEPDDPRGPCLERPPYSLARSIKKDPADTNVSEPSSIFYQKTGKYVHSHGLTGPNRRVRATNSKSVRLGFTGARVPSGIHGLPSWLAASRHHDG